MTPRRPVFQRCRLAALVAAYFAVGLSPSRAQVPAPPKPQLEQQVQNDRPKFLVRVSVDREYRIYGEGEPIKLNVRCEEDAYLYVLYQQADGAIFQIFPNSGQRENRIKGKQDVHVPDLDDAFRWIVGPPFGKEVIKVIASKKPVDALTLPGLKEDRFTPVTVEQVQGAGQELAKEPANVWSEHDLAIQTVRKGVATTPPPAHKRFGVFFGISKYKYNDQLVAAFGKDARFDLKLPQNDARDAAKAFQGVGKLNDSQVFLNEQATREQMRKAITEWLPSVSRPGDTVFIFFSGHGGQIEDDDNDEKDGKDEVLYPHDAMNGSVWIAFSKLRGNNELPPDCVQTMDLLNPSVSDVIRRAYQEAGGDANKEQAIDKAITKAGAFLARATAVGDDEMGHWIQKLDGRHVVVITDACRSGGLTPTSAPVGGKGLKRSVPEKLTPFDFLRSSISRLKDLDQPYLTVLAAASEQQDSIEFPNAMENGLFTAAILELLNGKGGPVDVRQAWEYTKVVILKILTMVNEARKTQQREPTPLFEPQFYSTETTPISLKPTP